VRPDPDAFGCAEKEDAKKHAISKGNSAIVIK